MKSVLICDEKQMSDERILGDNEFVNNVFAQLEEIDEKKKYFKNSNDLIKKLSKFYGVSCEDILKTKTKDVRVARKALVYFASEYLEISATSTRKVDGDFSSRGEHVEKEGAKVI